MYNGNNEQPALWNSAAQAFGERHAAIGSRGALATLCGDWNVNALVEHVQETQTGLGALIGAAVEKASSWDETRSTMEAFLAKPGSVEGEVEHPALGIVPRTLLLAIATNDMLIHTWDLSRALGVDDTLPEQNIAPALAGIKAFPDAIRTALFAAPIEVGPDATPQQAMLAFAGRAI